MHSLPVHKNLISSSEIDRAVYSRDASFYTLQPSIIVKPQNIYDIISIFNYARIEKQSITFRAAGTSLSGQALTDSILVDISAHWRKFSVLDSGRLVKTEPGVIGASINRSLAKFGRSIGPDPASLSACMAGGIAANNSSGMRSGIDANAYSSVESLSFVLPTGHCYDSSKSNDNQRLKKENPDIYHELETIRDIILSNNKLKERIIEKYKIKNTVGYSLNSFVDFYRPLDILAHLMIGSEGTLGFISSITFKTYPVYSKKLTGILVFDSVVDAAEAVLPIKASGVSALEIIDNNALKTVHHLPAMNELLGDISGNASILLIEFEGETTSNLESKKQGLESVLKRIENLRNSIFSFDSGIQNKIWSIRKGLLASLGASRTPGTTFILEDICIPLELFPIGLPALSKLFTKFGYSETGVYGHGMDGNLHFMLTQDFTKKREILRYESFMDELAELVIFELKGSLKAEHGTGRNIAPFVEREWGSEAYDIMKRIKVIIDPDNIMNPGVIINNDDKCHVKNIKLYPILNHTVDKCIECGFCEPFCPSADFTLTPRKRIIASRLYDNADNIFDSDFEHQTIDTCAVDGLCASSCPAGINTGEMVKSFRSSRKKKTSIKLSNLAAENFNKLEFIVKCLISSAHLLNLFFSQGQINWFIERIRKILTTGTIPFWNSSIGKPEKLEKVNHPDFDFIYFPCCVSRIMGSSNDVDKSLFDVNISISEKAGLKLKVPEKVSNYCCGTIFSSKGFDEAATVSVNRLIEMLWEETDFGRKPIVFDSSSCYYSFKNAGLYISKENKFKYEKLILLDNTEFINDFVLPNIKISKRLSRVVLHYTCSTTKLDLNQKLRDIASYCSDEVVVPENMGCCGMAGDRGLLFPGLTQKATMKESEELKNVMADGYYSSNIPCENAMTSVVNKRYLSIAYLVDRVSG